MHLLGILVLIGVVASIGAPAITATAAQDLAMIDPVLASRVSTQGLAPAVVTWDRTKVDRSEVTSYLSNTGLETSVLGGLSAAFACATSDSDLEVLAGTPGAVSVYGDRALTPALDRSLKTAFNGEPSSIWDGLGVTGKGVSIGVVDTGVDGTHPDLQYGSKVKLNVRVIAGKHDLLGPWVDPCIPNHYTYQVPDSEMTSGHGTHLTSVAAGDGTVSGGRYTGVAPGADVIGVGIMDTVTPKAAADQYTQLSLFGAMAGFQYIIDTLEGCKLPSEGPLGGGAWCPEFIPTLPTKVVLAGWTQKGLYDSWHPMGWMIEDMAWYGINVVFPVGNEGPEISDCSAAATCHFNPFAVEALGAIGVAATPKTSRALLEPYSSRGDPVVRVGQDGEDVRYQPFLAAPGTGVVAARRPGVAPYAQPPGSELGGGPGSKGVTTDRRYVAMSGTSVAAAHVAGAIALMQEAARKGSGCYLSAQQVSSILRSTATPMQGYASWEVGAGALNVTAAVHAASGGGAPNPDPWMCPPSS
jgi:serine protease AprX